MAAIVCVALADWAVPPARAIGPLLKGGGAGHGCAHCGAKGDCGKVCYLVQTEREIDVTCWSSRVEPICLPCPSKRGCRHVEGVCCHQGKHGACGRHGKAVWYDWCPGGAKPCHRKLLLRKTVTIKVPSYKWEVDHLCKTCQAQVEADAPLIGPEAEVPPPPDVEARVIAPHRTPRLVVTDASAGGR